MQDRGPQPSDPPIDAPDPGLVAPSPSSPAGGDPPTIRSARVDGSSLARRGEPRPLLMPAPGDRLESFELERPIGSGGMGAVFLAIDSRLHREVALKILPPEQSNDSEVVQRFYQEGRAAARLDHENIARVFTIGADKGHHFIAFEYIEGATLRQRVEEHGPLRVDEAINYTLQIAGALVHASERGVVHRDIKPSNIIVTPQGRAKLVDMGLARSFERGHDDGGLTQSGMTLGTFDYISPEQARDPRSVDVRGDLYSLGCTLFHMLTGRPPFPEGTVLQKLLQHQEEPPPDVRSLNPAVPPALATILVKLMAKERERRYQTPELLVRDLLTVAGALGLRSISPEGLVWLSPRTPSWEKHLVWGIPAAALAAAVLVLAWWGQPADPPASAIESTAAPATVVVAPKPEKSLAKPETPPAPAAASQAPEASGSPRLRPREVRLKAGDDLAAALTREASGSTLILGDDGPYPLAPGVAPAKGRRDLTIRAAPEARPVIRPARGASSPASGEAALLAFGPGTVVVEGVEFLLDAPETDASWSAIRAEGADLTLKRCAFRRGPGRAPMTRQAAVRIRPPASASGDAARANLMADGCHVDAGLVGLWVKGPADLRLRDVTFGPGEPAVWLDNGGSASVVPVDLSLAHCSLQAGSGPAFKASRTALRATVDRSVVATLRDRTATLVATDEPSMLDWRGRSNVYSGIETYLEPTGKGPGRDPIRDLAGWTDDPEAYREVDSRAVEGPIWEGSGPLPGASRRSPSSAFTLRRDGRPSPDLGARRGPYGRIISSGDGLASLIGFDLPRRAGKAPPSPKAIAPTAAPETPAAGPIPPPTTTAPEAPGGPPADAPPMPMSRPEEAAAPGRDGEEAAPMPHPDDLAPGIAADRVKEGLVPRPAPPPATAPAAIRTSAEFLAAVDRLGQRGGTLTLAADAELAIGPIDLRGMGRWIIQAEAGDAPGRPRLRFAPGPADPQPATRRPSLFVVHSGGLELQGVDVLLPESDPPGRAGPTAFALGSGADLALSRCTVTALEKARGTALVAVLGDEDGDDRPAARESAAAQVRVSDCLLRSEGDVLDVAPGRGLKGTFTNVVVGASGSLAHGHGTTRGLSPSPIDLSLRQVTARVLGGVAYLESAPGSPELPAAEIAARDTILTTDGLAAPMIRIDGQEDLESLRDRVSWEGHGVIYHQIDVYRLDQSARTGTLPQRFRRPSWDMAVAPRDDSPLTGDVKFAREWDLDRSPATLNREDAALDPDGPAPTAGPDLGRIPDAPAPRPGKTTRGR